MTASDAQPIVTLAEKLGTSAHESPLLQKARRLGLNAEGLEALACRRGCSYYSNRESLPPAAATSAQLSNEELAIALLNPALRYHPQTLRLGAAMLGAPGNDFTRLAWLATQERCGTVVAYVARAGRKFEPANVFWGQLLALLPTTTSVKEGVLPHETRFVAMTGLTRRGIETVVQWIRPAAAPLPE